MMLHHSYHIESWWRFQDRGRLAGGAKQRRHSGPGYQYCAQTEDERPAATADFFGWNCYWWAKLEEAAYYCFTSWIVGSFRPDIRSPLVEFAEDGRTRSALYDEAVGKSAVDSGSLCRHAIFHPSSFEDPLGARASCFAQRTASAWARDLKILQNFSGRRRCHRTGCLKCYCAEDCGSNWSFSYKMLSLITIAVPAAGLSHGA